MHIWSLHPQYLDPQGLVALRRETLLGSGAGADQGYTQHPQFQRFKACAHLVQSVAQYLSDLQPPCLWCKMVQWPAGKALSKQLVALLAA